MLLNEQFAKFLEKEEALDPETLIFELKAAEESAVPLYSQLIKDKCLGEFKAYSCLASFLGMELHGFQVTETNLDLVSRFPREKLIELQAAPYKESDDEIVFAISNPFRLEDLRAFHFNTEKKITCFLALPSQLSQVVAYLDNKIQQSTVLSDYSSSDSDISEAGESESGASIDAPVIKLCDSILKDAVQRGASDIHLEPFEKEIVLRFRIDGELTVIDRIPVHLYQSILARFKIMSEMNIAERRVPQDGKIGLEIDGAQYDFRVSTIPTIHGEKIVIRIYNKSFASSDLDILGFNPEQKKLVLNMITRPHGILLLTGPTGSGKSTSLYAFLRYLNRESVNIITVEDPVENEIPGVNQVQVNPKANLTFASSLRSILRQDPNIIMIGEIRDEETAQIATRAAITGHLVLSTIHTNDAAGVVTRLINMGIPKYLVADSLLGAISQRLVRKLCPECKEAHTSSAAEMKMLGLSKPTTLYTAKGCRYCNHTGYYGRTGIFEIMVCNDKIRDIITSDDFTSEKLNQALSRHMVSLLENAKEHVLSGETSLEEYEKLSEVVVEKNRV